MKGWAKHQVDEKLLRAARDNQPDVVWRLIHEEGADPFCKSSDYGHTPLHAACAMGHLEVARVLIRAGVSAEITDNNTNTPVHLAALQGHTAVLDLLAEAPGFSIDRLNRLEYTALTMAVTNDDPAIISRLLDLGADPRTKNYGDQRMPFSANGMAEAGEKSEVLYLFRHFEAHRPPDVKSEELTRQLLLQGPPEPALLHPKIWVQFPELTAKLQEQGTPLSKADLLTPLDEAGTTALMRAADCHRLAPVLDYLHERGEDLTLEDLMENQHPTALLATITERQSIARLCKKDYWENRPLQFGQFLRTLPEEGKAQITNLHALCAETRQNRPQQSQMER